MAKKRKPTTDAIEILHRRYYEGRPDRLAELEAARTDDEVARKIYQLRTRAELSQRALATTGEPGGGAAERVSDPKDNVLLASIVACKPFPIGDKGNLRQVRYRIPILASYLPSPNALPKPYHRFNQYLEILPATAMIQNGHPQREFAPDHRGRRNRDAVLL